jgi:predicted ABC-type ATPase
MKINIETQYDILTEGLYDPFVFKAIFICGAPGSGKSSIERRLGLEARGLKPLNADITLFRLNHWYANAKNINYAHAGATTEDRFNIWINNFLGLVLNTTGRDYTVIERLNKKLKKAFYNTFMVYIDVDENIARDRILNRQHTAQNPIDKNRIVNLDYFNLAYSSVKHNLSKYQTLFKKNFAIINNDDFNQNTEDFNIARKKINNFLMAPASLQAQNMLKGIKTKATWGIGRKFINSSY